MSNLKAPEVSEFNYHVDKFDDVAILRYRVPDLETLTQKQKELLYYLIKAGLQGYDIIYDQNGKYNLLIRRVFEAIYTTYSGDKEDQNYKSFEIYLKKIWMSNGIYHHYSNDKFTPSFTKEFLISEINKLSQETFNTIGMDKDKIIEIITPIIFDPKILPKKTNRVKNEDLILTSAGNYYEGITQKEAEEYYNKMKNPDDKSPPSYGLNSKLIKENDQIYEKTYKLGGMYSKVIEKIIYWLEKAMNVAENQKQKTVIEKLISFYKSGSLKEFDDYSIDWISDTESLIDFVNGFIETYGDPLGLKASWESIVNFKNLKACERTTKLSDNAQWFESNSPVDDRFKKPKVKGITAKVITVGILTGDLYPSTAIGINLPNADWIRAAHGSKSVTLENITEAYDRAAKGNGFREEFVWSEKEIDLLNKYGFQTSNLHTDLHECLGHASGQILPGVDADGLKSYGATIEEGRADLFALYYIADKKIIELGLLPDDQAYKAEYYSYFMNGLLTQTCRIQLGKDVEETHMRNRQWITKWVLNKAKDDKAVEIKEKDGKHYVIINDYEKIRMYCGELLAEVQRIKSTGDYDAAKKLVEDFGVKIDRNLHEEILRRYKNLNITPYKGFVNPVYNASFDKDGKFEDIIIDYSENFIEQHLRYAKEYSLLPTIN